MRLVLFDLGRTLEDGDVLLPGARETLEQIAALGEGPVPAARLGLVSDFHQPTDAAEIPILQQQYYAILDHLGIRSFFEPVAQRVTLSTEVGVRKPAAAIFRAAVEKFDPGLDLTDVLFITENFGHVQAARALGMRAIHFRGPGQTSGEVDTLLDVVPLVRQFVQTVDPIETDVDSGGVRENEPGGHSMVGAGPDRDEFNSANAVPAEGVVSFRVTSGAAVEMAARLPAGSHWVRFGDQVVVTEPSGNRVHAVDSAAGTPDAVLRASVSADHLHLVTQNGRLFQDEHPDIPVLVDKGRYLLVDLDPAHALRLTEPHEPHEPCYSVQPLPLDTVIFQDIPRSATRAASEPWIQDLVDAVSPTQFQADLERLVDLGTRFSTSSQYRRAAEQARDDLEALGYAAEVQPIDVRGKASLNVIAERTGTQPAPRDVVLVTAHLDSINGQGGPMAPAPGADDNASGSAGLTTIARALSAHTGELDLRLILFGGEEEGLFGSLQYVAALDAAERQRIRAVVNMDMIGTVNTAAPTVLLEGAAVSETVIQALSAAADTYTGLAVQTSLNPFNSDHVPFIDAGIPAVLTIEGADGANHNVHTANDTLAFIDDHLPIEILRMNTAFVAQLLKRG